MIQLPATVYNVKKLTAGATVDANWNKAAWKEIEHLTLTHHMGERPSHFPKTMAKLAYDDEAIYVIFRVKDKFVRATATAYQDPVYRDSCVEFFFAPDSVGSQGYFNLEINCGGTALFCYQTHPRRGRPIKTGDFNRIAIAHSLPRNVEPEKTSETTWFLEYRLPFAILSGYSDIGKPSAGTIWRANLYKCADGTSHPHWLTRAPVSGTKPDFHRPDCFGALCFE